MGRIKVRLTKRAVYVIILITILSIFSIYLFNLSVGLVTFLSYIPALFLFMLNRDYKEELLKYVTKWYSIILGISLVVFFLTFFINIPSIGVFLTGDDYLYDPYDNYVFFIKQRHSHSFIYRFNGPFLEPGHQAMISGIMLFANKFRFKDNYYLWILFTSILISLSLAGYVILIIGLIFVYVQSIIKLFSICFVGLIFSVFVTNLWNDGDNPVNLLIFERLQYDDEKGIVGNNRFVQSTDDYFEKSIKNGTIILGERSMEPNKRIVGAGYKIFLLRYGVITTIMTAFLYLLLINPQANKRYAFSFFILMCIIFLQRAYPTWYSWLLPYALGTGIYLKNSCLYAKNAKI